MAGAAGDGGRWRWQSVGAVIGVLVGTITSGTLECDPLVETQEVAHGREVYGRMCAICHGGAGEGYKADQAPALGHPAFLSTASDEFLAAAITLGRGGSTMSAWGIERGGPLARRDVAAVVAFMRTWQKDADATLDDRPIAGDVVHGGAVYAAECARCHGSAGTGGPFVAIGNPQLLGSASHGFLRAAIRDGRRGTEMAAFGKALGDKGVEDVLAFVKTLPRTQPPSASRPASPARPPPLPLGPVPLNAHGPEPKGFDTATGFTKADVIAEQLRRGARMGILDARAPSDYSIDHITGAVSVPFYDPEPYISSLPRDAWLVCYCGCPHAESGQLAQKLRGRGFTKVTVLDEGLRYWSSKKYGTHAGLMP